MRSDSLTFEGHLVGSCHAGREGIEGACDNMLTVGNGMDSAQADMKSGYGSKQTSCLASRLSNMPSQLCCFCISR